MAYRRPRHSQGHEPRMEMTPLMDVIFLLLTFFIYSIVVSVRANILPVKLPSLSTGEAAKDINIVGVTVDKHGDLFLNQEKMARDVLEAKLKTLAGEKPPPRFFLAMESETGGVDRGPLLIELIEMFRRLKIESFNIVGTQSPPTPTVPGETD